MTELRALHCDVVPPLVKRHCSSSKAPKRGMEGRTWDALDHYGQLDATLPPRRRLAPTRREADMRSARSALAALPIPTKDDLEPLRHAAIADGDVQGTTLLHTRIRLVALRRGEFAAAPCGVRGRRRPHARHDVGPLGRCRSGRRLHRAGDPAGAAARSSDFEPSQQPLRSSSPTSGRTLAIDDGDSLTAHAAARQDALAAAVDTV